MSPTHLLDVNVLVALCWPSHVHFDRAHRFFEDVERWATTPITELGLVRVSSNPAVFGTDAVSTAEARMHLGRFIGNRRGHVFWPDDRSTIRPPEPGSPAIEPMTHRQVTDAHLLLLAQRHGGVLGTFDRGLQDLAGRRAESLVHLIT